MPSIGHEISYDSGQKNHWRRWVWNRIVEALPRGVAPRDATVLYLAGAADLDWPEAQRRGFRRENMIACEKNAAACKALRARGVTVIPLPLDYAMMAWPAERPVHVVHADLCSGISDELIRIMGELFRSPFSRAAVAINMLRGRDPTARELLEHDFRHVRFAPGAEKDRGMLAATLYVSHYFRFATQAGLTREEALARFEASNRFDPIPTHYHSYRQAGRPSVMDSIVFQSRFAFAHNTREALTPRGRKARRALAAALAIQTMRKQGTLPSRAATV